MRRLAPLFALALLSGCAASQCNPNQAGFFTGIGCAVGPGYTQRNQELHNELYHADTNAIRAEGQMGAARSAQATAEANLAAERTELWNMQRVQRQLAQRLAAAKANHAADQTELAKAQQELASLQAQTQKQAAAPTPNPAAIKELKAKQARMLALVAQM